MIDKNTDLEFIKDYAEHEVEKENVKKFGKMLQKIKQRKSILQRIRDRFRNRKVAFDTEGTETGRVVEEKDKLFNADGTERRRKLFGGRLFGRKDGFFSPERTKKRREFRVKVSGNRKWIMIGVAVVAVCGTIIYLSVTYGGGGISNLIKMLGAFR